MTAEPTSNGIYPDESILKLVNKANLMKIEAFLTDSAYKEAIENSSTYNSRLCRERRLRMPFLDSQTGVAQNHSALFMSPRERIPGLRHGQIYTYPSKRWRKKRRQYLMNYLQPRRIKIDIEDHVNHTQLVHNDISTGANEDSKESMTVKEEHSKDAWYYDEQDMLDIDPYDEPDPDSDFDYEESYSSKRKKRKPRGGGHHPARSHPPATDSPSGKRTKGGGRGRKKANYDPTDSEKPFVCDLCSARYKTRPGLVYHYGHSHSTSSGDPAKELSPSPADVESRSLADNAASDQPGGSRRGRGSGSGRDPSPSVVSSAASPGGQPGSANALQPTPPPSIGPQLPPDQAQHHLGLPIPGSQPAAADAPPPGSPATAPAAKDAAQAAAAAAAGYHPGADQLGNPGTQPAAGTDQQNSQQQQPHLGHHHHAGGDVRKQKQAQPSPYCDFCLGDARENKKTGGSEELVSCSDCGRSGHPTCLQFTTNMIVSVRKYRWQCIECKCCSICGTSDNDDQLLFCDDCDRGYHMYCLAPPLSSPPEGSWSCSLCIVEFHQGVPKAT